VAGLPRPAHPTGNELKVWKPQGRVAQAFHDFMNKPHWWDKAGGFWDRFWHGQPPGTA
jgi:hypothetical protein